MKYTSFCSTSAKSFALGTIVNISAFTDSATARAYGRSSNCGPSSNAPVKVLKRPPSYARAANPVTMLESRPPLR